MGTDDIPPAEKGEIVEEQLNRMNLQIDKQFLYLPNPTQIEYRLVEFNNQVQKGCPKIRDRPCNSSW